MTLYAESAELQLLIKVQGLNNCLFRKLINILSGFFCSIELSSVYFAIYFLNVTQNYVKQASQNIYVKHLREKECLDKAGEYTVET